MIPAMFEYHAPTSIGEATQLLAELGEDAKVLSGGQSLIPLMKLRLATPRHLVDINGIRELAYIREADGFYGPARSRGSRISKSRHWSARGIRCSSTRVGSSPIPSCETSPRWAVISPTATLPTTTRQPCWRSARKSWQWDRGASAAFP